MVEASEDFGERTPLRTFLEGQALEATAGGTAGTLTIDTEAAPEPTSSLPSNSTSPKSSKSPQRRKERLHSSPSRLRRLQKQAKSRKWDPDDPFELWKFAEAQKEFQDQAVEEICQGRKKTHWSWFIIPTPPHMSGDCEVGSPTNRFYALRQESGPAYLSYRKDGIDLRQNYIDILIAIRDQLKAGKSITALMGAADGPKLQSSAAFFERVAKQEGDAVVENLCREVLDLVEGNNADKAELDQSSSVCCCLQ